MTNKYLIKFNIFEYIIDQWIDSEILSNFFEIIELDWIKCS